MLHAPLPDLGPYGLPDPRGARRVQLGHHGRRWQCCHGHQRHGSGHGSWRLERLQG